MKRSAPWLAPSRCRAVENPWHGGPPAITSIWVVEQEFSPSSLGVKPVSGHAAVHYGDVGKVSVKCRDGLSVKVNSRQALKTCAFQPERKTAAAAEEINKRERLGGRFLHSRTPSTRSETLTPSAFASRQMLRRLGLRTPRSMPLM